MTPPDHVHTQPFPCLGGHPPPHTQCTGHRWPLAWTAAKGGRSTMGEGSWEAASKRWGAILPSRTDPHSRLVFCSEFPDAGGWARTRGRWERSWRGNREVAVDSTRPHAVQCGGGQGCRGVWRAKGSLAHATAHQREPAPAQGEVGSTPSTHALRTGPLPAPLAGGGGGRILAERD